MNFCHNCGAPMDDDENFCRKCGAKRKTDGAPTQVEPDEEQHVETSQEKVEDEYWNVPNSEEHSSGGEPLFEATRSMWYYPFCTGVGALFCITLFLAPIGILMLVYAYLGASHARIEIYKNKIVVTDGILSRHARESLMTPIVGVSVDQSMMGRLLNYGDVRIDKIGKGWDIDTHCISHPEELKEFLDRFIKNTDVKNINTFLGN